MIQLTKQMTTEQTNERSRQLDQLSVREIVEIMNEEDQSVAHSVSRALPQIGSAIEAIVPIMEQGGRLFYFGAGTSGRLGILDASECPPTFGVSPELVIGIIAGGEKAMTQAIENAEDNAEAGKLEASAQVTSRDAVIGIAASGRTPYVIGALQEAARIGALTVSLSCNANAPMSAASQYPIEVPVGPEIITGSTRLKAGTATKMVLNMITTGAMIQLGKVYGNLMVNVQATNAKLKDRVVRIVQDATHSDEETAKAFVNSAKGDARVAILMLKFNISQQEAAQALQETGGHFGKTIELLKQQ
ncbi:N-acetylmuramic acid 6-phosphate etherase [Paenibacillus radicis (ex Xue et al. 2023)]|uniref:N-acetylmuramic acid 6-phosphate etherase n=1 Tax=Paenibacillus radicis (ex Xue et al. 2023) TaxID=2972489 RepID=A0ABT1YKY5_9BACL|nr:N-acetylmuramic acid 6-phosphate etherase [Paenibacillus radicis (ex Xue et al. 2023)]MCR8632923.1 N-acetylmuramic acid 6-phosphate etherase [Paenibacillus radicis (ex Xue et al. 2023)]